MNISFRIDPNDLLTTTTTTTTTTTNTTAQCVAFTAVYNTDTVYCLFMSNGDLNVNGYPDVYLEPNSLAYLIPFPLVTEIPPPLYRKPNTVSSFQRYTHPSDTDPPSILIYDILTDTCSLEGVIFTRDPTYLSLIHI